MRRLLAYGEGTAGGLMTPEVIILGPTATVAEALAHVRDPDWLVSIAAQVFVVQPPFVAPTGTLPRGRALPAPAARTAVACRCCGAWRTAEVVAPDTPEREVAERLAAYNLLAIPVCDGPARLLGAITVDDVLDRALPAGVARSDAGRRCVRVVRCAARTCRRPGGAGASSSASTTTPRPSVTFSESIARYPRHRPLPRVPERRRRRVDPLNAFATRAAAVRPVRPWLILLTLVCRCRPPTPRR